MADPLPIDDVLDQVVRRLRDDRKLVIQAPPGAGKSTRVPPALLDSDANSGEVVVLEPRRVAARAVASRIAAERGTTVGDEVGWHIRWDRRGSAATRLWVVTEGILTRRVQSDPFLEGIGTLILDEFHERSIHTDLALGFARELLEVRDDLRLVVMSATLDAERVAKYLDCPTVTSDGRLHPVDVEWLDEESENVPRDVTRAIKKLVADESDDQGDILVFLPGMREIEACRSAARSLDLDLELHRMHGSLPDQEQDAALRPGPRRKVIFSTNIAETSLTIEGVTAVIDTGLVKIARLDPATGFDRLDTERISLASADQRAGRAGRLSPGRAIRLWTRASEFRMAEFDTPAIQRIDLTSPILEVIRWSGTDPREFAWYEPPDAGRVGLALETLQALGAIDDDLNVTDVGATLSAMPLHPRIGRFLVSARELGVGSYAAQVAACLAESDWVTSVSGDISPTASDTTFRADLLDEVASGRTHHAERLGLRVNVGGARAAQRVARDLKRWTGDATADAPADAARRALVDAFPDRIAFRREGRRYALSTGGSVVLGYESTVRDAELILATSIFGTTRVDGVECGIARQASAISAEWLPAERFLEDVDVQFDHGLERLVARRVRRFDSLVMDEQPAPLSSANLDPADSAVLLARAAADDLVEAFGLDRDELRFLQRLDFLRTWMPELELPEPRDPVFLKQLVWGKTSFAELRRAGFRASYSRFLQGAQFEALDAHAPDKYALPSGRHQRIDYDDPKQPVLAARIQDFFGMTRTPAIAGGDVKLVLHLLAPNMRPSQVTQDLESFWESTYAEVRKELRARYPKHDWPEDPLS